MAEPHDASAAARAAEANRAVIEEFRAAKGRVGGMFEGADLLLLTTRGARSGRQRTSPVAFLRDGHRLLVFASNAGADTHPAWFHNLRASPRVTVEVPYEDGSGIERFTGTAVPLDGDERDRRLALQAERVPVFADYRRRTTRVIPVVALLRLDFGGDPERARAAGRQLLQAHRELREELGTLRLGLDDPASAEPTRSRGLTGHCLAFCTALGDHHRSEGTAFAAVEAAYPELTPTLDRLRDEHRVVVATLRRIEAIVARIARGDAVPGLRAELDTLAADLERHFAFEEDELLPVLGVLKDGSTAPGTTGHPAPPTGGR
ncbi:nitroreductase/quinone reductase family protein [Yinghuangia sp. ASG 101]|uniref:nitroreductase/quinone reductase family protein n=1 Tax=Yinghuangia sp. ASG 101 TaxID=2896848 RepID=UPI001E527EBE|nr:nitroreductase/quinone reductase family protein [Yinghuangia sp. ASG 101]UGQ13284.1 nitroreductase/quinone reductase family protein [Yinghuangia sp. ASG 101]